ncbi:MAG: methionyl-tRNA formyltransferase [Flavobacteriales bacterium]|nr:methionyl-tRNA formyltransferase [Flavobacteriales bacterium]HQV76753.1 formyltransferase family protein [Flavobacteriales bacterium]
MPAEFGTGLYLMTAKGEAVLQRLLADHGPNCVNYVVVAHDAGIEQDCYDSITRLASDAGIPVHDRLTVPQDLKQASHLFAVSWRWLIPLSAGQELIVLHDSLLPRYRGFAPLVSALINGDPEIGVTALFANEEYDRGPIIAQKSIAVNYPITIAEAISAIAPCYAELSSEVFDLLRADKTVGRTQDDATATYSLWRDEQDYFVDWSWDAERIRRFVDAVGSPYKGAATLVDGKRCRILSCEALPDVEVVDRSPGKVIFSHQGKPVVVCGKGLLRILRLIDDPSRADALPLPKFRVRFKGYNPYE